MSSITYLTVVVGLLDLVLFWGNISEAVVSPPGSYQRAVPTGNDVSVSKPELQERVYQEMTQLRRSRKDSLKRIPV